MLVRLFEQGLHIVEVSDDGHGVPASCRRLLATAHATSKIRSLREIGRTLGFRGEALHSLAALCEKLIVATRVDGEDLAEKLEFQNDGSVNEAATSKFPRKVGTTVAVLNFFQPIPVRRMHLKEQISSQRAKLVSLVEAYAIFHPGVRIHLMDIVGRQCNERTVLSTAFNCTTLPETISSVLGSNFLDSLCPVDLQASNLNLVVTGMISKARYPTVGRSALGEQSAPLKGRGAASLPTRKLFAINRRPVELPKLKRLLNEVWSRGRYLTPRDASWCLNLTIPIDQVDVNLSPDKRAVALEQEEQVFQCIASYAQAAWISHTAGHFDLKSLPEEAQQAAPNYESEASSADEIENLSGKDRGDDDSSSPSRFNRRYAFSHDVSKARLQHEFDDGRKRRREDQEQDAEAAATESSIGVLGGSKRLKQLHITSFVSSSVECSGATTGVQQPVTPSPVTTYAPSTETAPPDESTAGAIRKATAPIVSASKHEGSVEEEERDANLETLDELPTDVTLTKTSRTRWEEQQRWRCAQRAFNASSSTTTALVLSGLEDDIQTVAQGTPKFGFAQFGLNETVPKPSKRTETSRSEAAVIERKRSTQTSKASKGVPPESQQNGRAASPVCLGEGQHETSSETTVVEQDNNDGENEPSPFVSDAVASSSENDAARAIDQPQEVAASSATSKMMSEVAWDSFGTTLDVVVAARRERLALRDRKRAFDESSDRYTASQSGRSAASTSVQLRNEDFAGMSIVGQFNCGFILAKTPDNHLWILDQHACDEKANFERLCEETVVREQRLMAPLPLELSLAEEMCVMDNLDVFRKNGFRFRIDASKPPRHRLSLTALPESGAADGRKSVVFGKDDVSALCAILGCTGDDGASLSSSLANGAGTGVDGCGAYGNNAVRRHAGGISASRAAAAAAAPAGSQAGSAADKILARLPKAIAMFASRACRGSIMIGRVLSAKEMERVVAKMKDLQDPWTCAHGRPTIRHVSDLHPRMGRDEERARARILGPTTTLCTQHGGDDEFVDSEGE